MRIANVPVRERALRGRSGGDRIVRATESDEERVALRVDLDPVVRGERVAKHLPVRREHVLVAAAEPAGELGRPFDVGEEKGDGSGGEAGHDPAADGQSAE